ncbi:putative Ig domain-containing protein [Microbacterium sp. BG28]|uniref:putative Ig domain-containing protein n=1 Tax=Microbacterium sp. BG28 TaxID=3097356 RepID=UPI002A599342|nr:putative Ig domain-containing protein [Microbacterium sp. BG28]MDY0830043.1 putative Ig domain-containing protein [Microbacterium sp. BG28]
MRRRLLPLALIAAGAATLLALPAQAAEPLQTVTGVVGTGGSVQRLALSPGGSTGYIVDGSPRLAIFDTATSAVVAHSIDFAVEGFGLPTDVAISPDGSEVDVSTTAGWVVRLDASGALTSQIALPGTGLGALSIAAAGETVVAAPSAADPTRILRFNIGVSSVSGIDFAADAPGTPRPSALSDIAAGPGNGSDNNVLVAGTAAGAGVVYLFNDPFALAGQSATILLPGAASAGQIAVNPAGTLAAVTAPSAQRVFLIDIDASSATYGTIVRTATVPHDAAAAAFSPDGTNLLVVGANNLSTLEVATGGVTETTAIDTTDAAAALVSPSGNRVWVGNRASGAVGLLSRAALTAATGGAGTVGAPFTATVTASAFDIAPTFTVSPALPAGLALDAATGTISGTPLAAQPSQTYTITASASDGTILATAIALAIDAATEPTSPTAPTAGAATGPERLAASGAADASGAAIGALGALLGGGALVVGAGIRRRGNRG